MPVTPWKNHLYRFALPLLGMRVSDQVECMGSLSSAILQELSGIFQKHHVVGASLQLIHHGTLGPLITYGYARFPSEKVEEGTIYRAASITKLVTAVGAMKLVELGQLALDEPVSTYLGFAVENPSHPNQPITLRHLLSHSSSICDGPGYERALHSHIPLSALLKDVDNYTKKAPGGHFRYSNLAAGMVGSIMEVVTGKSLEDILNGLIFQPLGITATYTLINVQAISDVAHIYRVLPSKNAPLFSAEKRIRQADPMLFADPEHHYLPAAGNLFVDAASLGKLLCMLAKGGESLLSPGSISLMQKPSVSYGKKAPHMSHGLGMAILDDPALCKDKLYGHQGFAYGAAEGVFYNPKSGNGFVFLNSGASEARKGHLALVNRDLIAWAFSQKGEAAWTS